VIFDVVTLFPGVFPGPLGAGVVGRAIERGLLQVDAHDLRESAGDKHRQVDDIPYGGGPGMVLKPEPIFKARAPTPAGRPGALRRAHAPGPVAVTSNWPRNLPRYHAWSWWRGATRASMSGFEPAWPTTKSASATTS